jgi:hypothetical protein
VRYLFIAGLEHSGTTLTEDLLARRTGGVGLGEVAAMFSPPLMERYLARWGSLPDSQLCSCGEAWSSCPVWGPLASAWDPRSELPRIERHRRLVAHAREVFGERAILFDSSKSLYALEFLLAHGPRVGLEPEDLEVLFAVKDARGFAASILAKRGGESSLVAAMRAMRWWRRSNAQLLAALERSGVRFAISRYEDLCWSPDEQCDRLVEALGLPFSPPPEGGPVPHIAIGNKDYLNHTRGRVRYDARWLHDERIQLAYLLSPAVRRTNRELSRRHPAAKPNG